MAVVLELTRRKDDERLAIDGGPPVVPEGFLLMSRWPRIAPENIDRIVSQLRSGLLTEMASRAQLHEFESEMAVFTSTQYAMATNSGTAALHCALAGLGIKPGDEVIVPSLTYIACAAAIVHQKAIPILADVDPLSYNVTPATVEAAITPRSRAMIVVHLHGLPADMVGITTIARRYGLPVIEDFSQAVGSSLNGRPTGGLGTVGVASLMAGKNLASAGEAGVLVTNDREVRNRAASLKCFGEAIDLNGNHSLLHGTLGYNYRISLLSAALVSQQLFRLEEFTAARREGARRISDAISQVPGLSPPIEQEGAQHCYHMYRFRFDSSLAGLRITLDQMREGLKRVFWEEGVPLVEFQNHPLSGHDLLQRRVGLGDGCPWNCQGRESLRYRNEDYPGALDAIRGSLVIGYPAQGALANPEAVDAYIRVFRKLRLNLRAFERFAGKLPSEPPWAQPARLF